MGSNWPWQEWNRRAVGSNSLFFQQSSSLRATLQGSFLIDQTYEIKKMVAFLLVGLEMTQDTFLMPHFGCKVP